MNKELGHLCKQTKPEFNIRYLVSRALASNLAPVNVKVNFNPITMHDYSCKAVDSVSV